MIVVACWRVDVCIPESFAVHKAILGSRSEVFEAWLNDPYSPESITNRFKMKNVKPEVLKEFLRFLYTDQVNLWMDWRQSLWTLVYLLDLLPVEIAMLWQMASPLKIKFIKCDFVVIYFSEPKFF